MHKTYFLSQQVKAILDVEKSEHQQSDILRVCLKTAIVAEQPKILDSLAALVKCCDMLKHELRVASYELKA